MSGEDRLIVIGLTGTAGAGKDTVAKILCALAGFERIALADPMKMGLFAVTGASLDVFKELDVAARDSSPRAEDDERVHSLREGLQKLGTESLDAAGEDTQWIDVALTMINYFSSYHPVPRYRFVIPDVRRPREAMRLSNVVRALGGIYETWRVIPPDGMPEIAESSHSSETSIARVYADREIKNCREALGLRFMVAHATANEISNLLGGLAK